MILIWVLLENNNNDYDNNSSSICFNVDFVWNKIYIKKRINPVIFLFIFINIKRWLNAKNSDANLKSSK